jgi:hypothetical protein
MRVAPAVSLSDEERRQLEGYELVLLAAEGRQNRDNRSGDRHRPVNRCSVA